MYLYKDKYIDQKVALRGCLADEQCGTLARSDGHLRGCRARLAALFSLLLLLLYRELGVSFSARSTSHIRGQDVDAVGVCLELAARLGGPREGSGARKEDISAPS